MVICSIDECCGCGVCETICPFSAISMDVNEEGFICPTIDEKLCRNCSMCKKACPILNENLKQQTHNLKIAQGYFVDDNKHRESASGGAATALAENTIDKGGCVFGSSYTENFLKAEYIKVENKKELYKLKSSKYIETYKNRIYLEVETELKKGRMVLFTGLPCDVAALKSYLDNYYDNLYTCELICHGPTAQKIQQDYIELLSKKFNSKVVYFNSRYKKDGIEKAYIKIEFENNKSFEKPLWDTEYGYAFAIYNRLSCYKCHFKENNRMADITVGDSWSSKNNFGDKKGVSIIYVHTKKGLEMLKDLEECGCFVLEKLDYESVKNDNPAIRESLPIRKARNIFSYELKRRNLFQATYRSKNVKEKIKYLVKKYLK